MTLRAESINIHMDESIWCPLPWSHVGIKNNGSLRMCSHSQSAGTGNTLLYDKKGNHLTIHNINDSSDILNSATLVEVRRNMMNNIWPSQCQRCKIDQMTGVNNRNNWEAERHKPYFTIDDAINMTNEDGYITEPKLISADIRIGNQCNLRCIMCFPGESTLWYKDYQEITGHSSFIVDDKTYNLSLAEGNTHFNWANDKSNIDLIIRMAKYLRKIKFGGGEPLIIKYHHYLLQELIAKGYAKDIELEYSVNLTIFPPALFELWQHFKEIRICASIDAYGEANDAIRYPSKWDTITKNLRMIDESGDNIIIFTSTTVSLMSLEYFSDLTLWIENQNYKKINKTPNNPGVSHLVYNPEWLNLNILGSEIDEIFDNLTTRAGSNNRLLKKINSYREYTKLSDLDEVTVNTRRKKFSEVFLRLGKKQNQDFSAIFPFAYGLAIKWSNS